MSSRKINWVSSIDSRNRPAIEQLEKRLADFYASNPDYYSKIDFTSNNWIDPQERGYQQILNVAKRSTAICEVGCGSSNILKHHVELQPKYSGCDFSSDLMVRNHKLYPASTFIPFKTPNQLPFESEAFDLVFSVFVIEHSTNPVALLDECMRILKPNGTLVVLCPDFLGQGRMTSQRAGFSEGTTSQKAKRGKFIDAVVTFYDNRVRIPGYSKVRMEEASAKPLFLVNLTPVMFTDKFLPDVDAVYVTCKPEMENHLRDALVIQQNSDDVMQYERERRIIFIAGTKKTRGA